MAVDVSELHDMYAPDGWLINHGIRGGFDAYWGALGGPAMVLHDPTVDGLAARVAVFARVWGQTHDRAAAEAAATELET